MIPPFESLLGCILFITMMLHNTCGAIELHFDLRRSYLGRYRPAYDVWTGGRFPASIVEHLLHGTDEVGRLM